MSHAAAAYILQKSNEVLSMIKAFKRKASNNTTNVPNSPQNDASNSSVTQTTAVNCMNLSLNHDHMTLCDNFDASNSNIYTEIDLINILPTKNLALTQSKLTSSSDSLSSNILCFLFNESNDLLFTTDHKQSQIKQINSYVNESVTSQMFNQLEMNVINSVDLSEQNPYEIDIGGKCVVNKILSRQQSQQTDESSGSASISDSSLKSNAFFTNISKSLKYKLKHMTTEQDLKESLSEVMASSASGSDLVKNEIDKVSFKKRIKFKLKTGLQLFKDAKVRCSQLKS